ncbi:MAG TPA: ATP synthase F0 subunit B [Pyrinomonadaceae bacterium]
MLLLAGGESWFNYPGLELWKFLNLAIFLAAAIYILRKKINEALLARRDAIQAELLAAQTQREQALARVAEADELLTRLDEHVGAIHKQATLEAEAERKRLAEATALEKEKLNQQAQREMEAANKLARKELRQFLAKRSVELARESVRSQMRPEDDTLLIKESIGDLRRTTV